MIELYWSEREREERGKKEHVVLTDMKKMDCSKVFGAHEEECHSSESGWTMYIGSPADEHGGDIHGDDAENWEATYHHHRPLVADANNSDDSMASDASSGPSFREKTWQNKKVGKEKKGAATARKNKQKRSDNHHHDHDQKDGPNRRDQVAAKVRKNLGWGKQVK